MPKYISYSFTATALRVLSVVNLAFSIPAFMPFGWESFLTGAVMSLNVSLSILLMLPDNYRDFKRSMASAGAAVLISLPASAMAISGLVRPAMALLSAASVIPVSVCYAFRTFNMLKDVPFLMMTASGWEIMISMIKCTYVSFSNILGSLAFASVAISGMGGLWISIPGCLAAVLTYSVVFIRSISGVPFVIWTADASPICDNDVYKTAYLDVGDGTDKFMYKKICRYMEESRSFLNPLYSLDNMARDLTSNKTYISKVLNDNSNLNFCQWVNRYRVEFSRELFVKDPSLKVRELSEMSSFNSQVTFNMAFKLFYEVTPGQWCKEQRDLLVRQERHSSRKGPERSDAGESSSPGE